MDPTTVPFELISYRGLLKSFDDIKKGNFMKPKYHQSMSAAAGLGDEKKHQLDETKQTVLDSIRNVMIFSILSIVTYVEQFLFILMSGYDNYVYSPMQTVLSPICRQVPRYIYVGQNNTRIPIFTANIITLARTFLVVPIAWSLKTDYNMTAFWCIIFHDFLDHLDGIVAKVQRVTYPNHDDPLLGGFLDAFCDKIVNVLSLWTILQTSDFSAATVSELFMMLLVCYSVMAYEIVIGIVRVEDFFKATYYKRFNIEDKSEKLDAAKATAASMEGKLKEKLESTGIACLCVSISKLNANPINNYWGLSGLICLLLTLRMAHKSLMLKLKARRKGTKKTDAVKQPDDNEEITEARGDELAYKNKTTACSVDNLLHLINGPLRPESKTANNHDETFEKVEMKLIELDENHEQTNDDNQNLSYIRPRNCTFSSSAAAAAAAETVTVSDAAAVASSLQGKESLNNDDRVDKVYTVGCFDLFHHGHIELLRRMRLYGKKVIVGVHDSRSIYKLKNRVPIDSTEKRMLNVKAYADEVFCVAGTDPSNFISCIVSINENQKALYVRGNDMPDFPSKEIVESLMPIKLLTYTDGVSSTQLRRQNYSHVAADDEEYLNKND